MKLKSIRTIKRVFGVILIAVTAVITAWGIFSNKEGIAIGALLLVNFIVPVLKID